METRISPIQFDRLPAYARNAITALARERDALREALATANEGNGDGSVVVKGGWGIPDVRVDDRNGIRWFMPPPPGDPAINDRFFIDIKRGAGGGASIPDSPHTLQIMASGSMYVLPQVTNVLHVGLLAR